MQERSSGEHEVSDKEKAQEASEKEEEEVLLNKRTEARKRDTGDDEKERPAKKEKMDTSRNEKETEGSSSETDYQPEELEAEEKETEGSGYEKESSDVLKPESSSREGRKKSTRPAPFGAIRSSKEANLPEKKIIVPKTIDETTMEKLGIWEKMKKYFDNIGWGQFVQWRGIVYGDWVREFMGNMTGKSPAKLGVSTACLHVKLHKEEFHLSVNDINLAVDLWELQQTRYKETFRSVPEQSALEIQQRWRKIGMTPEFRSGYTKGHELKSKALRMCHRVLAYNFYGKENNSNSLSQKELFILWCMETKTRINFGALVVAQLLEVNKSSRGRVALGHFITELARSMRVLHPGKTSMTPLPEERLDLGCLQRMKEVEITEDGW